MSEPIIIPPQPIEDRIAEHNYRVDRIWRERGSNAKPFQSPSPVPAAMADVSRVPAVEHGGSSLFRETAQ